MKMQHKSVGARDLAKIKEEAEQFVKATPALRYLPGQIAGATLSGGGLEKLRSILDDFFHSAERAISEIPEELDLFNLESAADTYGKIIKARACALLYVFVDTYRPTPRFSFSAQKRSSERAYQDELNERLTAVASIYLSLKSVAESMERFSNVKGA